MIRITDIKLSLDQALNKDVERENLEKYLIKKYRITSLENLSIFRKAIDARKKEQIVFVYSVDLLTKDENRLLRLKDKQIRPIQLEKYSYEIAGNIELETRPIIVGFGPAGIFSGLILARAGYKPIILERGLDIDSRDRLFSDFIKTRRFNQYASIQFGEGGAGTYSDGKLNSSINDKRCQFVLQTLVDHGADPEIIYVNKPHVGTDSLKGVIKSIRKEIINLGGEVRFDSLVTDLKIVKNKITEVIINNESTLQASVVLLGIGHSSRDTFLLIKNKGLVLERKPFSIGLRIEHPQKLINESQYGASANHPSLNPADYKLSYHHENGRTAYTFCMCPGGYVMCGTSEEGGVVTNGMSENARDNINANSALLVNINTNDFSSDDVLEGVYFQRNLEKIAFSVAGKNYNAPAQLVGDFLTNQEGKKIGSITPTYQPGITFVNFNNLLPDFICSTLKAAIKNFDTKIKGFAKNDALLTGIETRSSSPIRIIRNEEHQTNIKGIYSMGEGAGYAGGIMSSAVDGIKTAEQIIRTYLPYKK